MLSYQLDSSPATRNLTLRVSITRKGQLVQAFDLVLRLFIWSTHTVLYIQYSNVNVMNCTNEWNRFWSSTVHCTCTLVRKLLVSLLKCTLSFSVPVRLTLCCTLMLMSRYDMIWYDMIWYDMIWYDIMTYRYIISRSTYLLIGLHIGFKKSAHGTYSSSESQPSWSSNQEVRKLTVQYATAASTLSNSIKYICLFDQVFDLRIDINSYRLFIIGLSVTVNSIV
jgi:hypothetical protein